MVSTDEFLSEALRPIFEGDSQPAPAGAPVLPGAFEWRGKPLRVLNVLSSWKQSGDCTHGSGEKYLRRHCYKLKMEDGSTWEVYFERRARSARQSKQRWWLLKRAN
jgi:hypothetical protein